MKHKINCEFGEQAAEESPMDNDPLIASLSVEFMRAHGITRGSVVTLLTIEVNHVNPLHEAHQT